MSLQYAEIILDSRAPCGCAFCHEVTNFYRERQLIEAEEKEFDFMLHALLEASLRVGTNWPGIDIDHPRSGNWIRDCGRLLEI